MYPLSCPTLGCYFIVFWKWTLFSQRSIFFKKNSTNYKHYLLIFHTLKSWDFPLTITYSWKLIHLKYNKAIYDANNLIWGCFGRPASRKDGGRGGALIYSNFQFSCWCKHYSHGQVQLINSLTLSSCNSWIFISQPLWASQF